MSDTPVTVPKPKLMWLDPKTLEEPDVRITSTWDPEMLKMLQGSIGADGIQQPLVIIKDGEHRWIVDGKHRRDEALLKGIQKVPCMVTEGSLRQVMTRNLYLNRLRGGTKASEMIKVVNWLQNHEAMGIEAIEKETGLKRDYVEKMLQCGKAEAEVIDELDRERIGVGHAWEIARVLDRDVQLRLLGMALQYHLTVKDLGNVVTETLEIQRKRAEAPAEQRIPDPTAIPTIKCHGCGQDWPLKKVSGLNLCMFCYGLLEDGLITARKDGRLSGPEAPSKASN